MQVEERKQLDERRRQEDMTMGSASSVSHHGVVRCLCSCSLEENGHGSKSQSYPQVNIPIPTEIGSKMGGECTYPKMGGFDPQPNRDCTRFKLRCSSFASKAHHRAQWPSGYGINVCSLQLLLRSSRRFARRGRGRRTSR